MKKTIRYCDLCGREITGRVYKVGFGILEGDQINGDNIFEDIEQDMDFCVTCIEEIAEMVTNCKSILAPATVTVEEKEDPVPVGEKKPKEKKKPAKKVDAGKIWALRDAGWNAASIALEVGCSQQTVYNTLNKERPQMEV